MKYDKLINMLQRKWEEQNIAIRVPLDFLHVISIQNGDFVIAFKNSKSKKSRYVAPNSVLHINQQMAKIKTQRAFCGMCQSR